MSLPLYQTGVLAYSTGMALAVLIGFFFGFALERAGFGRATNLAAQFYFTDTRVLKVMFSAIVTNMVGLGLLGGLGVVDLSLLAIPGTFLWPALVGGLVLGAGFIVSGYCPGTGVVGIASGNLDALYAIIGVMIGGLAFGLAYPVVESFYLSGDLGRVVFPELLGIPWVVLALAVTGMAVAAFLGGEMAERWMAKRHETEPPAGSPRVRNRVFAAFGVLAALGVVTLALPPPEAEGQPTHVVNRLTAVELAQELVAQPRDVWLVDLRAPADCATRRIPGALCRPEDDAEAGFLATLPATRKLVLYAQADLAEPPASALAYGGPLAVLQGGYEAFGRDVLTAPTPPQQASPEAAGAYRLRVALHGHFSGAKTKAAPVQVQVRAVKRAVKKGGGC